MVRGCTLALLLWLALAAGYWYWLDHVFDPPGSIIGGLVVGLVVTLSIGALINARNALRDWALASRSLHGLPLTDRRLVAVSGTIHPVDKPLIAPFSGQECVICEYDLGRLTPGADERTNAGSDFAGFLMTPCVIRTARGDVKLLGFPILEGYDESMCRGFAAASNGYHFLKGTEFENRSGLRMVTILSVFTDVWSDEDGLVQKNMRLGNVPIDSLFPLSLLQNLAARDEARLLNAGPDMDADDEEEEDFNEQGEEGDEDHEDFDEEGLDSGKGYPALPVELPKMSEKRVAVGETVCAIGIYNEMRQGLLPRRGSTSANRLIRGSVEDVVKKSRGSMVQLFIGGLLGLLIVHAATYGVMLAYLNSADTIRRRQQDAFQAIQNNDEAKLRTILHRGLDPNLPDANGETLLKRANQLGRKDLAKIIRDAGAK